VATKLGRKKVIKIERKAKNIMVDLKKIHEHKKT
jgi:hypothetical protein